MQLTTEQISSWTCYDSATINNKMEERASLNIHSSS